MIKFKSSSNFEKTEEYFKKTRKILKQKDIEEIAEECLAKLKEVTPKDSGLTAESWEYEILREKNSVKIRFNNTNIQNGMNVALLLEYGHATKNGTWVEGRNYIDPVITQTYLSAVDDTWRKLKKL